MNFLEQMPRASYRLGFRKVVSQSKKSTMQSLLTRLKIQVLNISSLNFFGEIFSYILRKTRNRPCFMSMGPMVVECMTGELTTI